MHRGTGDWTLRDGAHEAATIAPCVRNPPSDHKCRLARPAPTTPAPGAVLRQKTPACLVSAGLIPRMETLGFDCRSAPQRGDDRGSMCCASCASLSVVTALGRRPCWISPCSTGISETSLTRDVAFRMEQRPANAVPGRNLLFLTAAALATATRHTDHRCAGSTFPATPIAAVTA
jgi:hypothetical protein